MTAKIINLRTRRKQDARKADRQSGDLNAAKHGRSKQDVALTKARADKARRDLDGHQRDPDLAD
ncbi:DUF4169 family protein [Pararhodobacter sp.]|uniref:DUF4169 family protein n=1 Tax=Pararhodobacter sp. TaxID=2127056 RepID=UPI002AFECDEE|nr:DUF4169 family protein [Pararhodobacter sp.]